MTKLFIFLLLSCSTVAFTQPVIQSGANTPAVGLTAPVSFATLSSGTGSAGANVTWDFSSLAFASAGTFTVVNPSATIYADSFPTATYGYTFGSTFSCFHIDAAGMEVLAYTITTPRSGNDYTPNPKSQMRFPFSFNDTLSDTYQKAGDPSTNTVRVTYDGYGSLILPGNKTYSNVVRVKESYDNGDDYQWYSLDPFMAVLIFDHNVNAFYWIGITPPSSVNQKSTNEYVKVFPQPAHGSVNIALADSKTITSPIEIINPLGQKVKSMMIASGEVLRIDGLKSGVYFFRITDANGALQTGKIVIE